MIAGRMVEIAKGILMDILDKRKESLNQEQTSEITSLLSVDAMKEYSSHQNFEEES